MYDDDAGMHTYEYVGVGDGSERGDGMGAVRPSKGP